MLSMPVSHPDIEEFIDVKTDLNRVTKANISIMVDREFMEAVKNHSKYKLYFKREETGEEIVKYVDAYNLFLKFAKNNWNYAEPGILFWSRIQNYHLQSNTPGFKFVGVNPCSEEPLISGGACLLGSLNLQAFVNKKDKTFDYKSFDNAVKIAIKALDDIQEQNENNHPLDIQKQSAKEWRQVGLGIMNLAGCLIDLGIKYGDENSIKLCDKIGRTMANSALKESALLASKKGTYKNYSWEAVSSTEYFKAVVDKDTIELVRKYGLRNSQLLTSAPTGSTSTMLNLASTGIEPIFANYYTRKTESLHGKDAYYKVYTNIVKEYMDEHGLKDDSELPDYFVTAQTLDYHNRLKMQAVWQKYIDASISSTVNLPNNATVEDIFNLYMEAYDLGLKGVTVFRDGCERAGILTLGTETTKKEEDETSKFNAIKPISRKQMGVTHGDTYCKKCACGTLYITVNRDDEGNLVEIFVHTSKGGICQANISALTRLASLSLRSGVLVDEVIDQLRAISCPACNVTRAKGKPIDGMSCPDIISRVLQSAYDKKRSESKQVKEEQSKEKSEHIHEDYKCPECGAKLSMSGGCRMCSECGWSKCE